MAKTLQVDPSGLVLRSSAKTYIDRRRLEVANRLQVLLGNCEVRKWFRLFAELHKADGEYLGDDCCKLQSMQALQTFRTNPFLVQRVAAVEEFILFFCGFAVIEAEYLVNAVHFQFLVDTPQLLSMQLAAPSAIKEPSLAEKKVFDNGFIAGAELLLRVLVHRDGGLVANPFCPGKPTGYLHNLPLLAKLVLVLTSAVEAEWYQKEIPDCPMAINVYASLLTPDAPIEQIIGETQVVEVKKMINVARQDSGVGKAVKRIREKGTVVMLDDYYSKQPSLHSSADGVKVSAKLNAAQSLQAFKNDLNFADFYGSFIRRTQPKVKWIVMEGSENCLKSEARESPPFNFKEKKASNSSAHVYKTAAAVLRTMQPDLKILQQGGRALYDDEDFDENTLLIIQRLGKQQEVVRADEACTLAWIGQEAARRAKYSIRRSVCGVTYATVPWVPSPRSRMPPKKRLEAQEATLVQIAMMLDAKKLDAKNYRHVCVSMLWLLLGLPHGAFVIIYDVKSAKKCGYSLPIVPIKEDLNDVFDEYARTLREGNAISERFAAIADAFASADHSGKFADKWSPQMVSKLAETLHGLTGFSLSSIESMVSKLVGSPTDGALAVLSLNGTVLSAGCRVEMHPQHALFRPNGTPVGMRHNAGVAVVEWLKAKKVEGVVFLRSDSGPLTVMFVDGAEHEIKAYQLPGHV